MAWRSVCSVMRTTSDAPVASAGGAYSASDCAAARVPRGKTDSTRPSAISAAAAMAGSSQGWASRTDATSACASSALNISGIAQVKPRTQAVAHTGLALDGHALVLKVGHITVHRALGHFQPLCQPRGGGQTAPTDELDKLEQAVGSAHGRHRSVKPWRARALPAASHRASPTQPQGPPWHGQSKPCRGR
jgi:hypothetical protein